jgi:hypothetical protein
VIQKSGKCRPERAAEQDQRDLDGRA